MKYSHITNKIPKSTHYYGWGYVVEQLIEYIQLDNDGVVLDTWCDIPVGKSNEEQLLKNKWIGISHYPPMCLKNYLDSERFQKTKDTCLMLISLSEHSQRFIQDNTNIRVTTIKHPKPDTQKYFDVDYYLSNPAISHSGFAFRDVTKFMNLQCKIKKIIHPHKAYDKKTYEQITNGTENWTIIADNLSNEDYIRLLTSTIGYAYYKDCSASNALLEHIMTHTPLLVNNIDPVVEYLGNDYPMYISNIKNRNLDKLLLDKKYIQEVSEYLYLRSRNPIFQIPYFCDQINRLIL